MFDPWETFIFHATNQQEEAVPSFNSSGQIFASTAPSNLGGWANEGLGDGGPSTNAPTGRGNNSTSINSVESPEDNTMPASTIAVIGICLGFFLLMCFVNAVNSYCSSRNNSEQDDNAIQGSSEGSHLSRTERKKRLLEYFESTGYQAKVQPEHLRPLPIEDEDRDIEHGRTRNQCQIVEQRHDGDVDFKTCNHATDAIDGDNSSREDLTCWTSPVLTSEHCRRQTNQSQYEATEKNHIETTGVLNITDQQEGETCGFARKGSCDKVHKVEDDVKVHISPCHSKLTPSILIDACAVCLEPFQVGDIVVCSRTESCPHIFHKDCFVDYMIGYCGDGTPCPSCRQPFCDESVFGCRDAREENDQQISIEMSSLAAVSTPQSANLPSTQLVT